MYTYFSDLLGYLSRVVFFFNIHGDTRRGSIYTVLTLAGLLDLVPMPSSYCSVSTRCFTLIQDYFTLYSPQFLGLTSPMAFNSTLAFYFFINLPLSFLHCFFSGCQTTSDWNCLCSFLYSKGLYQFTLGYSGSRTSPLVWVTSVFGRHSLTLSFLTHYTTHASVYLRPACLLLSFSFFFFNKCNEKYKDTK